METRQSQQYKLATEMTMFLVDNLRKHGMKVEMVTDEQAREALDRERLKPGTGDGAHADFSVGDMMRLNYCWNGDEVSLKTFAESFMTLIKQKDSTLEDAERIAKAYIESVKAAPDRFIPALKAENMSHARYFILNDGTVFSPEHPMYNSPEYSTQRGLYEIYRNVLGEQGVADFIRLVIPSIRRTDEENDRFLEMERKVSGSDLMQRTLEVNADKVNESRIKGIQNLIQYFEENPDYTMTEKAVIVKGALTYGVVEKKNGEANEVRIVKMTDANDVSVPVIGGEAAAVVEGIRHGMNFKDALKAGRLAMAENTRRSVPGTYIGWKVYKQSDREEDAVVLQRDAVGTGWCTGGALGTARSHLSGGDFHIYFEGGEPLIAIRTENGRMAEPPRGAHEGQFCTAREEQIAYDYIKQGNGIVAGTDYVSDIENMRLIMSPEATWKDAFMFPLQRSYANGEFGGDTKSWGDAVEKRIADLMSTVTEEERQKEGFYYVEECGYKYPNDDYYSFDSATDLSNVRFLKGKAMTIKDKAFAPKLQSVGGGVFINENGTLRADALTSVVGGVFIHENGTLRADALTSVGGRVFIRENGTLRAGALTSVGDGVFINENGTFRADALTSVGGRVFINENGTLRADALTSVGGGVFIYENGTLRADALTSVGEGVSIRENGTLRADALTSVGGDVFIYGNGTFRADALTSVGGGVFIHENGTLQAGALTSVGGGVSIRENDTLRADALTSVVGGVFINENGTLWADALTSVGGGVSIRENGTLRADALTSVGGGVFIYENGTLRADALTSVGEGVSIRENGTLILSSCEKISGYIDLEKGASIILNGVKYNSPGFYASYDDLKKGITSNKEKYFNQRKFKDNVTFSLSDGTVYGYQYGDTIYLTPAGINPNTPIHEYAHLWAKVLKQVEPDKWESLKEELKSMPQWQKIAASGEYAFIGNDEDRLTGEVLATVIGNKGEEMQMEIAGEVISEGKRAIPGREVFGVEKLREKLNKMVASDVFGADGLNITGETTLKVLKDFVEGKGIRMSADEGEKLAAMARANNVINRTNEYVQRSNSRFNEELQRQINGEYENAPHVYTLGYPGPILRSTGIPNLPIQVTSTKLAEKSGSEKHEYGLDEIKDLVTQINTPVAVFSYGDGTLAQNITVDIEHGQSHFLVGLSPNAHVKGVALEINSIRNVFPKDNHKWLEWIQKGMSRYLDKDKVKVLIAQQRTNPADVNHLDLEFVTSIVEKFENPPIDEKYFIIDNWQYYGVFLDDRSRSIIDREFSSMIPENWKKYADHVTVLFNDYENATIANGRELSKTIGKDVPMKIVGIGRCDTAVALKIEGVDTANDVAHVTLAVSPDRRPVDSNKITEWRSVAPIEIRGTFGLSYKGRKHFEILSENEVADFSINTTKDRIWNEIHQKVKQPARAMYEKLCESSYSEAKNFSLSRK